MTKYVVRREVDALLIQETIVDVSDNEMAKAIAFDKFDTEWGDQHINTLDSRTIVDANELKPNETGPVPYCILRIKKDQVQKAYEALENAGIVMQDAIM